MILPKFVFISLCFLFYDNEIWRKGNVKTNLVEIIFVWPTIGNKIIDTFTLLIPYFVTVIPFCPPSFSFQPPHPQTMLCGNCCELEPQTSNIERGSRVFFTVYCMVKRVMLFGALKVLLKDNVWTNYVADCSFTSICKISILWEGSQVQRLVEV